ncbi:hypothetical protein [Thiohalophilus thiocyanatoxydans]|uniref:Uncharacterized protein n=1 Tax=Thiohalophilus thiocyanatoxydans TaxID=381308 RepID=A0A4R8J2B4_9GAMM|nr:hypothetical protein [Thiohalophilus thiocyanatoxydans]TDY04003.1 hypothetical protein EDC23_0374 [Thiohalophilus thiocyanatoxydans]
MGRLITLTLILFSASVLYSGAQAAEYRVLSQENDKKVAYQANDFYSIYYLYFNVIQALKVERHLPDEAIAEILFDTLDNLKQRRFSQLQIRDAYAGPEPLRVTLRTDVLPDDNRPILWLISNYSHDEQAVVTGEAAKHAYGTYFYLIDDKLVKYQRIKEPKTTEQLAALSDNARADYYLLDKDADNDQAGKQLLLNALDNPASRGEAVALNLTLAQYHLLDDNLKGANARLDRARDSLREMSRTERRKLRVLFHHAKQLVALYSEYRAR